LWCAAVIRRILLLASGRGSSLETAFKVIGHARHPMTNVASTNLRIEKEKRDGDRHPVSQMAQSLMTKI